MPDPKPDAPAGPYTSTEVKTIEISGPIKFTLTTRYDSSHVPPSADQLYEAGKATRDRLFEALKPLAAVIMSKLDEILAGQRGDDPDPGEH